MTPAAAAPAADLLGERLARFAHEISNLLDGTMRYVSMARSGLRDAGATDQAAEAARQLDAASTALQRIAALVQSAMHPGAGALRLDGAAGRTLGDAIEHAVDVVRPLADVRGVRLERRVSDAAGAAAAGALYSVVSNALKNAVEACGPGGCVEIRAETERAPGGEDLLIDVIDTGVGPPEGAGPRVFEPGFSTKPGGSGLGLALSKEIVAQLGGTIELLPRLDGRRRMGAHLRVRCPLPGEA